MAFMIFCKRNVDIICFSQGKRPRVGVSSMPVLRTWGQLARKEQFTLGRGRARSSCCGEGADHRHRGPVTPMSWGSTELGRCSLGIRSTRALPAQPESLLWVMPHLTLRVTWEKHPGPPACHIQAPRGSMSHLTTLRGVTR